MEAQIRPRVLPPESLRVLHRRAIDDPRQVRALLARLHARGIVLTSGVDSAARLRTARIKEILSDRLVLQVAGIDLSGQAQLHFGFTLDGARYFFAVPPSPAGEAGFVAVALPEVVYEAERRDLSRLKAGRIPEPAAVVCEAASGAVVLADLVDQSYEGVGLEVAEADAAQLGQHFRVRLPGADAGESGLHGSVKHRRSVGAGRVFLGVHVTGAPAAEKRIQVEDRASILAHRPARWTRVKVSNRNEQPAYPEGRFVTYPGAKGRPIRAIVDQTGDSLGAPVVVIPPAWGKTKETFLALAQTLIQTFEGAGESLVVIRFDGTNRRGESYIERENRDSGREYLAFRFSEAVEDIRATLDHFQAAPGYRSGRFFLVTYSLGAIEGRRAAALDRRVQGWVSVVGMPDLQSGLRAVSGGIDYAYGALNGVRFGLQELVGVAADMDLTGQDAMGHRLVFAEDARRDMRDIDVPVTWIHGRADGWIELGRVRDLMSAGETARRKLIQIPAGHRMRTSREAYETFQLVAEEVSEMSIGRRLLPRSLDHLRLQRAGQAELARLPAPRTDLRTFWERYLLGGEDGLGIDLLASTSAYESLMRRQVELLKLGAGDVVLDLGCGTGTFPLTAHRFGADLGELKILGFDYVLGALRRSRARVASLPGGGRLQPVCADLGVDGSIGLPLSRGSVDAVLASLVVSYVASPESLLRELVGLLRPGGTLVLSSMRRDADISRIYVEGAAELLPDRVRAHFGAWAVDHFQQRQQQFLNEAARLLDLEERGRFRFFDGEELVALVSQAGFIDVEVVDAFGDPPQAFIVAARRA